MNISNIERQVAEWEGRVENICVEIAQIKDAVGIPIQVNTGAFVSEFLSLMEQIRNDVPHGYCLLPHCANLPDNPVSQED
jgi:hypothetical protein